MKTKALLLAGLVTLAGVAASEAQTVYSVNAVGFINVNVPTGYSMVANQLFSSATTFDQILPTPAIGTKFYKFNGTGYNIFTYAGAPLNRWNPIPTSGNGGTLLPGEGAFLYNPGAAFTLTFTGEVPTGTLSNPLAAGFSIRSSIVPQSGAISSVLGMPSVTGDKIYKFNGAGYNIFTLAGPPLNRWNPSEPVINVGEAFFLFKVGSASWDRNFSISSN